MVATASRDLWKSRVSRPLAIALHSVASEGPPSNTKSEDQAMKRMILAATLALVVVASAGLAAAGDMEGKIKTIEVNQKVLTLEDGTQLYWTDSVTVTEAVQSGALVRATYEEQDGRFMLTRIEVLQ